MTRADRIAVQAVFRDVRMPEEHGVRAALTGVCEQRVISFPDVMRVPVEDEEADALQIDEDLRLGTDAEGGEHDACIAVARNGELRRMGEVPHRVIEITKAVAAEDGGVRRPVEGERLPHPAHVAVRIGKHEDFHDNSVPFGAALAECAPRAYSEDKGGWHMKVDIRTVHAWAEKSDEKLWQGVRMLASGLGLEVPPRLRQRIDFDALRRTLASVTPEDTARFEEITQTYHDAKRGGGRR